MEGYKNFVSRILEERQEEVRLNGGNNLEIKIDYYKDLGHDGIVVWCSEFQKNHEDIKMKNQFFDGIEGGLENSTLQK